MSETQPKETTEEEEQPKETTEPPKVKLQSLVTEDLVGAALTADKGPDAEILSWEVKDFTKKGDNYICEVTSVTVHYRQANTEEVVTYVAKCSPCREVAVLNDVSTYLCDKEANFYNKLIPLINAELKAAGQEPMRMADCYVTHLGKGREVMLLRDLRSDGFKMFDRQKGMDVAHATLVLRELARLHAASILVQAKMTKPMEEEYPFLKKDLLALPENPDKEEKAIKEMMSALFYNDLKLAMAMAESVSGYDKVVDWLRRHARKVDDLLKECLKKSPPFDVLCHGDCWSNNILFKYDESGQPVDVRLLDLQFSRKASPATDINKLMYTSLNGQVRKDNLQAFLKSYYEVFFQVLSDVGHKTPFTFEELKKQYHDKKLFGLLMGLSFVPYMMAEQTDMLDFKDMPGSREEVMQNSRQKTLDQLHTNPLCLPRFLEIFDEMVEYGVIS